MEMYGLPQLGSKSKSGETAIEATPSTKYEPVHLDALEAGRSLTDQCGHCHRDIKCCNIQAQRAVLGVEPLSRDKFEPIEKRLQEHDLRLGIWSTDCGVAKGYLENIGGLSQPVGDIFGRFHQQLEIVAEQINNFRKDVPKQLAENNPIKASNDADTLVERHISELRESCNEMTRMLSELCVLQPLIQTAQALDRVGPQRELRIDILQLKSQYPQDSSFDITRSSGSPIEKGRGDEEDGEQCAFCNKWFSFGTLDFHQDLCSDAKVQREGAQPLESPSVGQACEATMPSGLSSGSKPEPPERPAAMKAYEKPWGPEHTSTWPPMDTDDSGTDEDYLTHQCRLFRILVVGKAGVGKSTLLSMVFNVPERDMGVVNEGRGKGLHSVWQENRSKGNTQLVIHESGGFEAGDTKNLDEVERFISHCAGMTELERQLHCIWYCIDCSDARFWSGAEKRFFAFCQSSPVPIVFVLTKFDLAVDRCLDSQMMQAGEVIDWQQMQIAAEIEARNKIKENIQRPLEKILGTAVHTETVSNGYPHLIKQLVEETTRVIKPHLKHLWISAQQVIASHKRERAISSSIKAISTPHIRARLLIPVPFIKPLDHYDVFEQLYNTFRIQWNICDGGILKESSVVTIFRDICQESSVDSAGLLWGPNYARVYLRWSVDLNIAFEMLFWRVKELGRTGKLSQNGSGIGEPPLLVGELSEVLQHFRNSRSRSIAHAHINGRVGNFDFSLPFKRKQLKDVLETAVEIALTEREKYSKVNDSGPRVDAH